MCRPCIPAQARSPQFSPNSVCHHEDGQRVAENLAAPMVASEVAQSRIVKALAKSSDIKLVMYKLNFEPQPCSYAEAKAALEATNHKVMEAIEFIKSSSMR